LWSHLPEFLFKLVRKSKKVFPKIYSDFKVLIMSSSHRAATRATTKQPSRNTSGEGLASFEPEPINNMTPGNEVQGPVAAADTVTDNVSLLELMEKLNHVQSSSERNFDQMAKSIINQKETLIAEIENSKTRMDAIEALITVRTEEMLKTMMAEAKTIITENINELRGEFIREKYDKNDHEDQGKKVHSRSNGEGEYPNDDEYNQRHSKCSTQSEKTKRTRLTVKNTRESKQSNADKASIRDSSKGKHGRNAMTRKPSGDPEDSSSESMSSDDEKRNKPSVKSNTDDEYSDSSTSSDDEIRVAPTRFRHLKNFHIRNSELNDILSYKSYRLRNQSQKFTTKMQKQLSRVALRMKTHIADDQKFSGTDPVSIIRFLEEFKEACDHNGSSEGAALHLFQYFIMDPAKKSLRLFLRSKVNDKNHYSYCGAVLFLLSTYAPEDQVNMERRKIFMSQQKSNESEDEFAIRLQAQASRFGQAFKESDLITSYLNGLPENVRTYINSVAPNASTFTQTQLAAQSAGKTLRIRAPPTIANIPLTAVRRTSRYPAPNYVYQHSSDTRAPVQPINNIGNASEKPQIKSCFVCSQEHHLHECPTLSDEQRMHAIKANERFMLQRQQREMLRRYNGNTYNGGKRTTYLMTEDKKVTGMDNNEHQTEDSSAGERFQENDHGVV
jgi:hypothetical protein